MHAAMQPAIQTMSSVIRKLCIGIILTSAWSAEPPADLARQVAERETGNAAARLNYTYRQSVFIEEFDRRGRRTGHYQETRDIVFSPGQGRTEEFVGKPVSRLQRLRLTEEDFRDIREVQPFLFTADQLWAYETRYRGEETIDGAGYYVLEVCPRQTFQGQRLFDGMLWIHQDDLAVVHAEGKAVPSIFRDNSENLFPRFTTTRAKFDGKHWFPVYTHSDDVLPFRTGPLRMRMSIRYSNYKRFTAESTITFEKTR